MKKIFNFAAAIMTILFAGMVSAATDASPVGLWKTIDDVTGKPKAIINITEAQDHTLQGTIVKIFPRPGHDQNELCAACRGPRHNQRIVGMTILEGLRRDNDNPGYWKGGTILDPKNGKTYRSTFQLTDDNKQATVRGYIGIPMFGRSQVWSRVVDIND